MGTRVSRSTFLLRVGIGGVFVTFGVWQLRDPMAWIGYLPAWLIPTIPFSAEAFLRVNGAFDLAVGILLLSGWQTRIIALLASLHLLGVMIALGFSDVAVRDAGLLACALALAVLSAPAHPEPPAVLR